MAALNAYWRQSPPVHVLFAAYVGYKPQTAVAIEEQSAIPAATLSEQEFDLLLQQKGITP
ncbi:MAG: hypothetical protein Q4G42_05175 [Neisseria sp.]|nr:hypothetical protein [Neisseria sp.]